MSEDHFSRALRSAEERLFSGLTSTAASVPTEPFTLGALRKLMAGMPKPDLFLSTRLFPGAEALHIEGSGENFTVAHPMFWSRFISECRKDYCGSQNPWSQSIAPLFGIPIIEIDLIGDEDEARRRYLLGLWAKLKEAVDVASVELPEWLRSAPAFTKFG